MGTMGTGSSRRQALGALAATVLAAPLVARAAPPGKPRQLGALMWAGPADPGDAEFRREFAKSMAALGYAQDKDIVYEWRQADRRIDLLPKLAAELVAAGPDALLGPGSLAVRALAQATKSIPIVGAVGNPFKEGYTGTIGRPVGNVTGVSDNYPEIALKMMEHLKAIMPTMTRFGIVAPGGMAITAEFVAYHEEAVRKVGAEPVTTLVTRREEAVRAFAAMRGRGITAAFIPFSAGFFEDHASIARLALESRVAVVDLYPGLARAGGLLTFSAIRNDIHRQMAQQLDKVLRRIPVREIPFLLPTKYWLTINRKTAATLGLSIPPELLLRADRVFD